VNIRWIPFQFESIERGDVLLSIFETTNISRANQVNLVQFPWFLNHTFSEAEYMTSM